MLSKIVDGINGIEFKKDQDTKGDLYEYLLSKVSSAGTNWVSLEHQDTLLI